MWHHARPLGSASMPLVAVFMATTLLAASATPSYLASGAPDPAAAVHDADNAALPPSERVCIPNTSLRTLVDPFRAGWQGRGCPLDREGWR